MNTAIITGSGGFIGRHLQPALEQAGWAVVGLPRSVADITDQRQALQNKRPAEALIHLAFPTSASFRREHPEEARRQVEASTANALELAEACNARQVILASSGKVYGNPGQLPTNEDCPPEPTTFLGELKLLQEEILQAGAGRRGTTSLRLFNVYGPGAPAGFLIPRLIAGFTDSGRLVLGELDHRRDWVHLDDVCAAFVTALVHPADLGNFRALNVGSGRSASARELIRLLAGLSGRNPEIVQEQGRLRPDEPAEERADCARLEALGWRAETDLETGIRRLWGSGPSG